MKREDFYYDSRDNQSKIHAVRWEPDEETEPVAVFQIIHGMCEHVDRYENFAKFLVEKGFVVTANDHLGHGKSLTEHGYGYFAKDDGANIVVRDVHRLKKLTEEMYPDLPYFILGHSMGSFIMRNYLFRYGKGIEGAIVMGTGNQPKSAVKSMQIIASLACLFGKADKPSQFIKKLSFGSYLSHIDNPRTTSDWLTKREDVVDKYRSDPACGFTFTNNGYKTLANLILPLYRKKNISKMPITLPVLIMCGLEDPVGDYGKGPEAVYESFLKEGMQKVTFKMYEGDRHEILNETDNDVVWDDIYNWVMKNK